MTPVLDTADRAGNRIVGTGAGVSSIRSIRDLSRAGEQYSNNGGVKECLEGTQFQIIRGGRGKKFIRLMLRKVNKERKSNAWRMRDVARQNCFVGPSRSNRDFY